MFLNICDFKTLMTQHISSGRPWGRSKIACFLRLFEFLLHSMFSVEANFFKAQILGVIKNSNNIIFFMQEHLMTWMILLDL